jgi:hypothetical protein
MKPNNVNEALDMVQTRLFAAGFALEQYLSSCRACAEAGAPFSPQNYPAEYFEDVKDTVLDAHMLVTWIKDNK